MLTSFVFNNIVPMMEFKTEVDFLGLPHTISQQYNDEEGLLVFDVTVYNLNSPETSKYLMNFLEKLSLDYDKENIPYLFAFRNGAQSSVFFKELLSREIQVRKINDYECIVIEVNFDDEQWLLIDTIYKEIVEEI